MHDSKVVANRFLKLAHEAGDTLTPMQLLKLVYIAHGWMLGLYGRPLVKDDIQAWQYGPVIPKLYNAVRDYRSQPVQTLIPAPQEILTPAEEHIIQQTYQLYRHFSGPALSRITHAPDTPWSNTYRAGQFGVVISNDLIEDHYQRLHAQRVGG